MPSCTLGIAGKISKQHYALLDKIVAEQNAKRVPVKIARIDPGCFGGIEWAMARGMAIVIERMNWEFQQAHTSEDRDLQMVIGQPTTVEDFAATECYYDVCSTSNPDYDDPEMMKPLAGDFLPGKEFGKYVGPQVNRMIVGDYFHVPQVEGVKVQRVWSGA